MKKLLSLTLAITMISTMLIACGNDNVSNTLTNSNNDTILDSSTSNPTEASVLESSSSEPTGVVPGTQVNSVLASDYVALQLCGIDSGAKEMYGAVYDTLFWSPSGRMDDLTGLLVDTWEISDDYLTVTLTLREDAYFTNGKNVTAQDVEDSFYYHMVDRGVVVVVNMSSYEAIGKYVFQMKFDLPNVNFMTELTTYQTGVIDPTLYLELGECVEAAYMSGSGPYYISDYAIGDYIVLTAKEDYWNPERQAHIETIFLKVITNTTTSQNALVAGEIDVLGISDYESMEMLQVYSHLNIIQSEVPVACRPIWMNGSGDNCEYLANARVREALTMMVDTEQLALAVGGDYTVVAPNAFTSAFPYEHTRTYDPDAALTILEEEGVDPSDIVMTALCTSGNITTFTNLQAQFMQCGVTLNFVAQEVPAVTTAGLAGEWDLWSEHGGLNAYNISGPFGVLMGPTASRVVVKDDVYTEQIAAMVSSTFSATSLEDQTNGIVDILQILDENYFYICSVGTPGWYAFNTRIENPTYHFKNESWMMWDAWVAE